MTRDARLCLPWLVLALALAGCSAKSSDASNGTPDAGDSEGVHCNTSDDCQDPTPICSTGKVCIAAPFIAVCQEPKTGLTCGKQCEGGCTFDSQICDITTGQCASCRYSMGPGCRTGNACDSCGNPGDPPCGEGLLCVNGEQCLPACCNDADCGPGNVCAKVDGINDLGVCSKKACRQDADCGGATPLCADGRCVACLTDANCRAPHAYCRGNACKDCVANADCKDPSRPVCQTDDNECLECVGDADCKDPSKPLCGAAK